MNIDFSTVLKSIEGKPIKEGNGEESKDATLGWIAIQALNATLPGEEKDDPDGKFKRFMLAMKIQEAIDAGGEHDFDVKDIGDIKTRIGKAFPTPIMGPAWLLMK